MIRLVETKIVSYLQWRYIINLTMKFRKLWEIHHKINILQNIQLLQCFNEIEVFRPLPIYRNSLLWIIASKIFTIHRIKTLKDFTKFCQRFWPFKQLIKVVKRFIGSKLTIHELVMNRTFKILSLTLIF